MDETSEWRHPRIGTQGSQQSSFSIKTKFRQFSGETHLVLLVDYEHES